MSHTGIDSNKRIITSFKINTMKVKTRVRSSLINELNFKYSTKPAILNNIIGIVKNGLSSLLNYYHFKQDFK